LVCKGPAHAESHFYPDPPQSNGLYHCGTVVQRKELGVGFSLKRIRRLVLPGGDSHVMVHGFFHLSHVLFCLCDGWNPVPCEDHAAHSCIVCSQR
jgi:hypothetical protein